MKKKTAIRLSLMQVLKMSARKVNELPEGTVVNCGKGWIIFRSGSSMRTGLWWFISNRNGCNLGDNGNPVLFWYHAAHCGTFKMAHELWLKSKDRLTDAKVNEILHQLKINDEDSYG